MKLQNRSLYRRKNNQAYASLAIVTVIGITALLSLMFTFRRGVRSHETQVRNQVKIDYRQKEDALLRALVTIVPNKAIGAMENGSAAAANTFSWNTIFTEAIAAARAEDAINTTVVSSFGIDGIIQSNTGDIAGLTPASFVSPIAGTGTLVGEGISANTGLLGSSVAGKLPPALVLSGASTAGLAAPIITRSKNYATPTVALFPQYNVIPYPDIRFGFVNQSGNFIAKRNWWAFSMTFGSGVSITNNTGDAASAVPTVTKNYVLSIYEVPSQLAVSEGSSLNLEGAAWASARIDGGVFGTEVKAEGLTLVGSNARISARRSIDLGGGSATVDGSTAVGGYDDLGLSGNGRESRWKSSGNDYYGLSDAGSSGRVAILPLSQGNRFIRRVPSVTSSLSPTGWDIYALGARQCAMQIEVLENDGIGINKPTLVRFHYITITGATASVVFEPFTLVESAPTVERWQFDAVGVGTNDGWENYNRDRYTGDHDNDDPDQDGLTAAGADATPKTNSVIPFYWENLRNNVNPANRSPVLAIKLERFPEFLVALAAKGHPIPAPVSVNNSLFIWSNPSDDTVNFPSIPSVNNEMGVVIRDAENLALCDADGATASYGNVVGFTRGFSLVTDHRVYLQGVINNQTMTPPTGSGIPLGAPYYPPLSIFAAEKRFGTADIAMGVEVIGQLADLNDDDGTSNDPLNLSMGTGGGTVGSGSMTTTLSQIVTPAQLPPIHKMSWLVTVEEIQ